MKQERFNPGLGDFSPPSRRHCDTCAQERIFQNFKCLTCGTVRAHIHVRNTKIYRGKERMDRLKLYKQAGRDKAAYLHQQAEASRAKFEGKK